MAEETKKKGISPLMILPPVLFALLAALFLWGMTGKEGGNKLPSTREGGTVPALTLTQLGDKEVFTDEMLKADGVKLVNFFASWCAPCRVEHAQLMEMQAEGIVLYGINYKDDPVKGLQFLEELGDPYTELAADPDGRTALDWGLYGVPETFVIDGNGTVVKRFAGPITASILENVIRPAMAEAAAN